MPKYFLQLQANVCFPHSIEADDIDDAVQKTKEHLNRVMSATGEYNIESIHRIEIAQHIAKLFVDNVTITPVQDKEHAKTTEKE